MGKRYFTLAQANEQIPALKQAFTGVMQIRAQLKALYASLDAAGYAPQQDEESELPEDAPDAIIRDRGRFYGLVEALREMVEDIHDTGCQIKDIESGLVDWLARSGGRDVLLCWKFGEAEVEYYHETSSGFAGRRPVSELDAAVLAPQPTDDEPPGLLH